MSSRPTWSMNGEYQDTQGYVESQVSVCLCLLFEQTFKAETVEWTCVLST